MVALKTADNIHSYSSIVHGHRLVKCKTPPPDTSQVFFGTDESILHIEVVIICFRFHLRGTQEK